MYWYERAPHYQPNGGGFSVLCFKLSAMYQLHQKVLCYWTQSNDTLPMIRYTGAKIRLYNSYHSDYIVAYHNCGPMQPNLQTYNATHPQVLQLNNRHKIMPCIKDRPKRHPYKTIKIKPRSEMTNRWFFQNELNDTPLLILQTAAMSLDRYFANSNSQSTTIGFTTLDTNLFQYHNFKLNPTSGYRPAKDKWLWGLTNGTQNIEDEKVINLIYLGDSLNYKKGKTIKQTQLTNEDIKATFNRYCTSPTDWGNPFYPDYLKQEVTVLITNISLQQLEAKWSQLTDQTKIGHGIFTTPSKPLLQECRYNPYSDNGDNDIFLVNINDREQHEWSQPTDKKLEGGPYPLWLSTFGFLDWQKNRLGNQTDLDYVFVMTSNHIDPKLGIYLPIDEDFINGRSPYQPENTQPFVSDQKYWQPKVRFQTRVINTIASCGPGTIKLQKQQTAEAHATCTFYFKLGGCAPETKTVEDPQKQPTYPIPNNICNQPSLQNPAYGSETFLYNFDYRRGQLTKTAIERMLKYSPIKESSSSFTDSNALHQTTREEETSESEEEKTQKETLLQLLNKQRIRQQQFKQRILQCLTQINSE